VTIDVHDARTRKGASGLVLFSRALWRGCHTDDIVVIELKRDKGGSEVVDQTARYTDWASKHLAKGRQKVIGIICVRDASEGLCVGATEHGFEVHQYNLSFDRLYPDAPVTESDTLP